MAREVARKEAVNPRIQGSLFFVDAAIFALSSALSLLLAPALAPLAGYGPIRPGTFVAAVSAAVVLKMLSYRAARVYRVYWACAGFRDAVKICLGAGFASALLLPAVTLTPLVGVIPPGAVLADLLATLALTGGLRFADRARREFWPGMRRDARRAIIVGAGEAGQQVGRQLQMNPKSGLIPVCYLDDDKTRHGSLLHGIPVEGSIADLPAAIRRHAARKVIIAVASAPRKLVQRVLEQGQSAGAVVRIVPRLGDILSGAATVNQTREVDARDLLGREQGTPDLELLRACYAGRTVMVTGAGGSIGSELCRQLAFLEPARLVLFEISESNLYHLSQELKEAGAPTEVVPVLGDVRDRHAVRRALARHAPEIVLHAAAYKHVPLLEANAAAAVTNNILGTRNLADCAVDAGVNRFVLISTDKAVRPSSVMGCTKRVAEMVCREAAGRGDTEFVTVRFGNVLDSDGSVVPLFRRQIAAGGPVTVTDREVTRYFMSIPEAAGLVLTAGGTGERSRVYVLEMGDPVRIDDLAREMIRLAGYEPDRDIEIAYTGLRPGEKLHEELWYTHEELKATDHPGIMAAVSDDDPAAELDSHLLRLEAIAADGAVAQEIAAVLTKAVPAYRPAAARLSPPGRRQLPARPDTARQRRPSEILAGS